MTMRRYSDLTLYARLLRQARPFWPHILCIFLLSMLATPIALLLPLPLQIVVDCVLGPHPLPGFVQWLLPQAAVASPGSLLLTAVCLLVAFTVLQHLEGFVSWLLQLYTGEKLVLDFRARLFRHVQRLSLLYHDTRGTSDSLYRIQYDASAVQYILISGLVPFLAAGATLIGMIYVTALISWQLALVAMVVVPVLFVLTEVYRRRMRDRWSAVKEAESGALSVVQEVLSLVRLVKAYGQEDRERDRFAAAAHKSLWTQMRAVLAESGFGLLVAFTLAAGSAAVLFLGVRLVQQGSLTLGQLLLVMAYLTQLYKPMETISRKIASLQSSMASAERVFALLDESPDVPEHPGARPLARTQGHIVFEDVSFSYGRDSVVLQDVSLDTPAGACVGISGRTGAGKTTLLSLLTRFYDPTAGRVLLDGNDLRACRLDDLRRQFAIVLQDSVLFSCSIAENIAYGRPGATRDEIIEAARAANAHDFISMLPNGYDTEVGERGMTLSGGERQRIALARAFLKDAPVLLLDEPTSSLDQGSEALVLEAMRRLTRGRTTFMVTHRLNTLDICDIRLQVRDGRVLAEGSSRAVAEAHEEAPAEQEVNVS